MTEHEVRLAAPFEHIVVTYPYEWAQGSDCLHIADEREGTGIVWAPAYAQTLVAALTEAAALAAADEAPE